MNKIQAENFLIEVLSDAKAFETLELFEAAGGRAPDVFSWSDSRLREIGIRDDAVRARVLAAFDHARTTGRQPIPTPTFRDRVAAAAAANASPPLSRDVHSSAPFVLGGMACVVSVALPLVSLPMLGPLTVLDLLEAEQLTGFQTLALLSIPVMGLVLVITALTKNRAAIDAVVNVLEFCVAVMLFAIVADVRDSFSLTWGRSFAETIQIAGAGVWIPLATGSVLAYLVHK